MPELDPALVPLRPAFRALCAECGRLSDHVAAEWPDAPASALRELHGRAHKLAGSAALFGLGTLGDRARAVERAIDDLGPARDFAAEATLPCRIAELRAALSEAAASEA